MPITATATVAPPPSHPHEILKTQDHRDTGRATSRSSSPWFGDARAYGSSAERPIERRVSLRILHTIT